MRLPKGPSGAPDFSVGPVFVGVIGLAPKHRRRRTAHAAAALAAMPTSARLPGSGTDAAKTSPSGLFSPWLMNAALMVAQVVASYSPMVLLLPLDTKRWLLLSSARNVGSVQAGDEVGIDDGACDSVALGDDVGDFGDEKMAEGV